MLSIFQKARLLQRFSALRIPSTHSTDLIEKSVVKEFHTSQSLCSDWDQEQDDDYFKGGNSNPSSRGNRDEYSSSGNNRSYGYRSGGGLEPGEKRVDRYRHDGGYKSRGGARSGGGERSGGYTSGGDGGGGYRSGGGGYRSGGGGGDGGGGYRSGGGGYRSGGGHRSGFGSHGDESLDRGGFYYPETVDTHNLTGLQRRKLDWSEPTLPDPTLERELFKDCKEIESEIEMSVDINVKSTTGTIHQPCTTFQEMKLGNIMRNNITLMKLRKPTPIQSYTIPIIKEGHNILGSAQTGSGKTAAFLIPVIDKMCQDGPPPLLLHDTTTDVLPVTLIMAPTRELAIQTFNEAQKLTYRSQLRPYVCYGGSNIDRNISELQKGTEILVATPGRLKDLHERGVVSMRCIQTLILDEADFMFDKGFSEVINELCLESDMPKDRQTLLFSATFPPTVMGLAKKMMSGRESVKVSIGRVGSTCDTIEQRFINITSYFQKKPLLLELMGSFNKNSKTLVFVATKVASRELAEDLAAAGYNASAINGDLSQRQREQTLAKFKSGQTNILVATEVAARGLDIPSIDHVVNFDMPDTVDQYVHRIGRTGRVGRKGTAVTFVNPKKDQHLISGIRQLLNETKQKSPDFMTIRDRREEQNEERERLEKVPSFE